jgi:small subunit ribosomal protein S17
MGRGKVKTRVGVVTSDKMNKTVVVDVTQMVSHPKYRKPIKKISRFKAHDEKNECRIGDKVFMIETRPLSRTKRWRVSKILERATILKGEVPEEVLEEERSGE